MASVGSKRTRGPNKQTPWSRNPDDDVSVLRLAVEVSDPVQRRRLDVMFSAGFSVYRAVQSDARHRARAYWAATRERAKDPAAVRARLGLSRKAFEHAAYAHVDQAPHLRRFVTKAVAMNLADSVWTATERHLFRDASGKTFGMPRIGRYFDFTRLPGRAQSHTKPRTWESFRLVGSLAEHRAAYTRQGSFVQPRRLRPIDEPQRSWWDYAGPLAVVFTGLPDGDVVLPVRLPTAPCNQPILDHHLADPSRWHKIDLIRHRDPHAPSGWRYEAHLMVLVAPYVSPAVAAERRTTALATVERNAGIDVNVSNVTIASHEAGDALRITRVELVTADHDRIRRKTRQDKRRQRDLDRSRRAANRTQYQLSKRQAKRARRRAESGLPPVETIPMGPRVSRADGKPMQAYRRDQLSNAYRRGRASYAAAKEATARAKRDRARETARTIVRDHGTSFTVEDVAVSPWARRWGRSLSAFSPATLLEAITREAKAVGREAGGVGDVVRASTRTTQLSQHCLCGARVHKTLANRVHDCPCCGLRADRDAVSATLAAFVVLTDRDDPGSARVDFDAARASLYLVRTRTNLGATRTFSGRQDALSESNVLSRRDGWFVAERGPTPCVVDARVARRIVGMVLHSTPDESRFQYQATQDRVLARTNLSLRCGASPQLRDSS